jgi:hypothetical protein
VWEGGEGAGAGPERIAKGPRANRKANQRANQKGEPKGESKDEPKGVNGELKGEQTLGSNDAARKEGVRRFQRQTVLCGMVVQLPVSAIIAEGLGRGEGAQDDYQTARGEATVTILHLRSNFAAKRIDDFTHWHLRNGALTVIKRLDSLLGEWPLEVAVA